MLTTQRLARPSFRSKRAPDDSDAEDSHALADGTWLGEFRIIRRLGSGGFGIVYLALDTALRREVAIKEYMPMAVAKRGRGGTVDRRADPATFAAGLQSFLYEARLLASFDHPALVKVHRFWEANNTAYMAMRYCPGRTLKDERARAGAAPDEKWLRGVILPILDALGVLHNAGVYHRDISPDNIVLLPDGAPVLLDFGSARRVIGDRTQALTAILKPNFAPVEQYADVPGMRQGPWTDLYALGAVVHFMLTGQAPVPSVVRTMDDTLPKLRGTDVNRFPGVGPAFLAAMDWALQIAPNARPQSADALRQALERPAEAVNLLPFDPPATAAMAGPQNDQPMWVLTSSVAPAGRVIVPAEVIAPEGSDSAAAAPTPGDGARAGHRRVKLVSLGLVGLAACVVAIVIQATQLQPPSAASLVPEITAALPAAVTRVAAPARQPESSGVADVRDSDADRPPPPLIAVDSRHRRPTTAKAALPSKAVPARPTAIAEAGPRSVCGERNLLAMSACVRRECSTPRFRLHAECLRVQREEDERLRREIGH